VGRNAEIVKALKGNPKDESSPAVVQHIIEILQQKHKELLTTGSPKKEHLDMLQESIEGYEQRLKVCYCTSCTSDSIGAQAQQDQKEHQQSKQ
jgi:hypothetical protein